jgi:hypothetical protein
MTHLILLERGTIFLTSLLQAYFWYDKAFLLGPGFVFQSFT